MTAGERGFLLLCSHLGNPARRPLTPAQLRKLTDRMRNAPMQTDLRDMETRDVTALGYSREDAARIIGLLNDEELLDRYLAKAAKHGCVPITRVSPDYPVILRRRLGADAPGCLWARGDVSLLHRPAVSLVGSRDLLPENAAFARQAGAQAARQDFVLISGNARGADRTAQDACFSTGGSVISVLADKLADHVPMPQTLYLSEDGFDLDFSPPRALSRNRVIHALGQLTLVAQSSLQTGGTWDGSVKNLRFGWSPLYCFDDGRESTRMLEQMGAQTISMDDLSDFSALPCPPQTLI